MKAAFLLLFAFFVSLMVRSSHGAVNFLPEKFNAKFSQEYKSVVTGSIKRGTGQFDYQYPSQVRFEMFTPDPLTFIANKKNNWLYRPPFIEGEEGELKKNVKGGNTFSTFFDALKAGLKDNSYYKINDQGKMVDLIFSKDTAKKMTMTKASLHFKNASKKLFKSLADITLHYKNGKKTKIIFEQVDLRNSFPKDHFTFKRP